MDPPHRPQVRLIPETCGWLKNKVPKSLAVHLFQLTRASTSGLPVQAIVSVLSISFDPSKKGSAIGTIGLRNFAYCQAMTNDSLNCPNPHVVSRIPSLAHGGKLSREMPFESSSMLQIYWDGPYLRRIAMEDNSHARGRTTCR